MLLFCLLNEAVFTPCYFFVLGFVGGGLLYIDDIHFIVDEILEVIRARRGEIGEDRNTPADEAEKAKSDGENDQTDTDKGKEESGDQDKTEETPTEQDVEKVKTEGKGTITVLLQLRLSRLMLQLRRSSHFLKLEYFCLIL